MSLAEDLKEAKDLIEANEYVEAAKRLTAYLKQNFDDPHALFLLGFCFYKSDSHGLAYQVFRRAADIYPGEAAIWHHIGLCYHERQEDQTADEYFRKAIKCKPDYANALEGLAMTHLNRGDYGMCVEYSNRVLAQDEDAQVSRVNRGMAYLALGRWLEGWRDYGANVGKDQNRTEIVYGGEVRWDGSKGKDVVVYGEQGIGDELSFASCLQDLIRDSKSVTIECDGRLEGLFKRSFPTCDVHGTRYKPFAPDWRSEKPYEARVAIGQLPSFYRQKKADFHGESYLIPNPQMALQWRALLASLGPRPKIGISWTGGLDHTGKKKRSVTLDTLAPLFAFDADWVSLQYKDTDDIAAAEEKYGVKIHHWDWGTQVYDYDQTVALISELDLVISVTTTVVHAAGGLGKECWCLVPNAPIWRYMQAGAWFPWAKSVTLFRQKGREWPIHLLHGKLKDKYAGAGHEHRAREEAAA